MVIIICLATFISTLLGGLITLKFEKKLNLIFGISAGAVIGVAFFDLLPTAMGLSLKVFGIKALTSLIGFGFVGYLSLDRLIMYLNRRNNSNQVFGSLRGKVAAVCLTMHSFIDGVAIGIAFQVSASIGGIIAIAVLIHDFADGMNTTNVILKARGNKNQALKWLVINAAAPLCGACSTYIIKVPAENLGCLLAIIAGFFLYIGASDLLPESQNLYPQLSTTLMTVLGISIIYAAVHFLGA